MYKLQEVNSKEVTPAPIGTKLFLNGAYNCTGNYAVISEKEAVRISEFYSDEPEYLALDFRFIKPLSEKFGIGIYIDNINPKVYTKEEIEEAKNKAYKRIVAKAEAKEKAKAEEDAQIKALIEEYKGILTPIDKYDVKGLKKNIIAYLKYKFPKCKFTARSDYDCFDITFTGEENTKEEIQEAVNIFEAYTFNLHEDYLDSTPKAFNKAFGYAKYIHVYKKELVKAV